MVKYLTMEQVLEIHYRTMARWGEGEQAGVLFKERFAAAVLRPQQTYFGKEVFPTLWDKVGALVQSIVQEHIFHNANKRTAFAVLQMFLFINGYHLDMDDLEAEEMMVSFVTEDCFKGEDGARQIGQVIKKFSKPFRDNG